MIEQFDFLTDFWGSVITSQGRLMEQEFIYLLSCVFCDKVLNFSRRPTHPVYIYYCVCSLFAAITYANFHVLRN